VQAFVQFLIIGLGAGATYALFAQGAVLIYRGSGLVNFAQWGHRDVRGLHRVRRPQGQARCGDASGDCCRGSLPPRWCRTCSRRSCCARCAEPPRSSASSRRSACSVSSRPSSRSATARANQPVDSYLPHNVFRWGSIAIQEERIYLVGITLVVTFGLWAWTRLYAHRPRHQRERAERTRGADTRMVPGSSFRADVDARWRARRICRGARGSAHRTVGGDVHDRRDRRRSRCRIAGGALSRSR